VRFNWVDNVTVTGCTIPVNDGGYENMVRFHECGGEVIVTNNDADPGGIGPDFIDFTGSYVESGNSWN
jgi:hypothetical protein